MFMFKLRFIATGLLWIFIAAYAGAQTSAVELPAGPMQSKARSGCTVCHDAHILVQQRLSKAAWGKEVDKMIKWGAIVSPSDRDALVEYFSNNFPPDKSPYIAQRSAPNKH
jgi:hypothetical protein